MNLRFICGPFLKVMNPHQKCWVLTGNIYSSRDLHSSFAKVSIIPLKRLMAHSVRRWKFSLAITVTGAQANSLENL